MGASIPHGFAGCGNTPVAPIKATGAELIRKKHCFCLQPESRVDSTCRQGSVELAPRGLCSGFVCDR